MKKSFKIALIYTLAIVIFVICCIVVVNIKSNNLFKKTEKIYKASNMNIIYIGRESCGYCQIFTPIINDLKEKFNLDYTYVDIDKLTHNDFKKLLKMFGIEDKNFGTPYLVITQNGQIIGKQMGYTDELNLFLIMQEVGIIDKNTLNPYIVSDDNETIKKFNDVFNSDEKKLIYLGRPKCKYCQMLSPIMEEIKEENNINYYYINVDEISRLELSTILYKLNIKASDFGTPYLVVTENGVVIKKQSGYAEKAKILEFLQTAKLIR